MTPPPNSGATRRPLDRRALQAAFQEHKEYHLLPTQTRQKYARAFRVLAEDEFLSRSGVGADYLMALVNYTCRAAIGVLERHRGSDLSKEEYKFMFHLVQGLKIRLQDSPLRSDVAEVGYSLYPLGKLFRDVIQAIAADKMGEWLTDDDDCQIAFVDAWMAVDSAKLNQSAMRFFEAARDHPITINHRLAENAKVVLVASACYYAAQESNPFQLCTEAVGRQIGARGLPTNLRKAGSRVLLILKDMGIIKLHEAAKPGDCEELFFDFTSPLIMLS